MMTTSSVVAVKATCCLHCVVSTVVWTVVSTVVCTAVSTAVSTAASTVVCTAVSRTAVVEIRSNLYVKTGFIDPVVSLENDVKFVSKFCYRFDQGVKAFVKLRGIARGAPGRRTAGAGGGIAVIDKVLISTEFI